MTDSITRDRALLEGLAARGNRNAGELPEAMAFLMREEAQAITRALNSEATTKEAWEHGLHDMARKLFAAEYPGRNYDDLDPIVRIGWLGSAHVEILSALRNRTSEPEAGEAVGQVNALYASGFGRMRCIEWTAGEMPEVGTKLYTHHAPATADKLKVAVDALERIRDYAVSECDHEYVVANSALAALNEGGE